VASVGNLEVAGFGVRRGKRWLLFCKEVEKDTPVVWDLWKSNEGRTNSWIVNG
jgi:hypothetical protein